MRIHRQRNSYIEETRAGQNLNKSIDEILMQIREAEGDEQILYTLRHPDPDRQQHMRIKENYK